MVGEQNIGIKHWVLCTFSLHMLLHCISKRISFICTHFSHILSKHIDNFKLSIYRICSFVTYLSTTYNFPKLLNEKLRIYILRIQSEDWHCHRDKMNGLRASYLLHESLTHPIWDCRVNSDSKSKYVMRTHLYWSFSVKTSVDVIFRYELENAWFCTCSKWLNKEKDTL